MSIKDLIIGDRIRIQEVNGVEITVQIKNVYRCSKNECWKQYTHYLWEQKHGPVPKGYCLIHLNQNRSDCSEENIALVSRKELVRINKLNLTSTDRNLTKAGINFVKLLHKQKEVKDKINATK